MLKKNCSEKAISVLEELKSIPWKDIGKAWYNELIQDKQVALLDLVKLGSVSCSGLTTYKGYGVPDTQRAYVIN